MFAGTGRHFGGDTVEWCNELAGSDGFFDVFEGQFGGRQGFFELGIAALRGFFDGQFGAGDGALGAGNGVGIRRFGELIIGNLGTLQGRRSAVDEGLAIGFGSDQRLIGVVHGRGAGVEGVLGIDICLAAAVVLRVFFVVLYAVPVIQRL